MSSIEINDVNVNYKYIDSLKQITLVYLHGWGQNIQMMEPLAKGFESKYNILIVDLPGFGKSEEPHSAWDVYDYAECINKLILSLKIKKIILLGHSFGGKIALVYASKYKVEKLVVFASPFCKEIKKLPLKTKFYKFIKNTPGLKVFTNVVKKFVGSTDYKNASEVMRNILVKTVNLEIYDDIKKIKCPTLIVWGTEDTAVPVNRAYELEKLIDDSGVVIYDGATHYAYLERLNDVKIVLNYFFEK